MLKMIICEDITVIRSSLVDLIRRHHPEYDVCGVYYDGRQVIEHLQKEPVDLIVTDIRMKEIGGIEVLKYVYDNRFRTRVIVITAYADFDYAMSAVNYHAVKFILKPIAPAAFLQAVEETAAQIAADKEGQESTEQIAAQARLRSKLQRRLADLSSGKLPWENFRAYCQEQSPALLEKGCLLLHISVKPAAIDRSLPLPWYDLAESAIRGIDPYIVATSDYACTLLVFADHSDAMLSQYEIYIAQLEQVFLARFHAPLFLNATKFDTVDHLYGEKKEDFSAYIRCIEENNFARKAAFEQSVLESWNPSKIVKLINFLCKHYEKPELSVSIRNAHTKEQTNALFREAIRTLGEVFDANYRELVIKKVDQYLQMNFATPDLSLTNVAAIFNFSPAYLSSLFSKHNNVTFSARLMELRLEHGKQLLKETKMPIKEIAAACGYTDKYFTRLFNKKMGVTPRAYRDRGIK